MNKNDCKNAMVRRKKGKKKMKEDRVSRESDESQEEAPRNAVVSETHHLAGTPCSQVEAFSDIFYGRSVWRGVSKGVVKWLQAARPAGGHT
jgi:hypothetical protein